MQRTVMIVDDDLFYRELLRDILVREGYTVVAEATNGREAVERYKQFLPAITIMDIFMPGDNGIDATRDIISFDGNARVLVCSGVGFDEDIEAAMSVGAKDIIYKPFMVEEITASMKKALES